MDYKHGVLNNGSHLFRLLPQIFYLNLYVNFKKMAIIIKTPVKNIKKEQLIKELKKFAVPNRNPKKATEDLFGIWEGRDISIKKIREKNNRNKW